MSFNANERRATNRANFLLIDFLRNRYDNLIRDAKDEQMIMTWLELDTQSRLLMFNCNDPTFLSNLKMLDHAKRSILIQQLCNKHFIDFDASHNVPLDAHYFNIPQSVTESIKFPGVGQIVGDGKRKNSRDSIKTLSSLGSSTENDEKK